MIELRWITRNTWEHYEGERVLQYRQEIWINKAEEMHWSEWAEVPEVPAFFDKHMQQWIPNAECGHPSSITRMNARGGHYSVCIRCMAILSGEH